jgi:hypothetical protein
MEIDSMLVQIPDYTKNANLVKEIVLSKLYEDKIIDETILNSYLDKQVIIINKSWFKRLFSIDGWFYRYVDVL